MKTKNLNIPQGVLVWNKRIYFTFNIENCSLGTSVLSEIDLKQSYQKYDATKYNNQKNKYCTKQKHFCLFKLLFITLFFTFYFAINTVFSQPLSNLDICVISNKGQLVNFKSSLFSIENKVNGSFNYTYIPFRDYSFSQKVNNLPLAWDIIDTFLICIYLYPDNSGNKAYSQLRRYDISILSDTQQFKIKYLLSSNTLVTQPLPVDIYLQDMDIKKGETLGPIYFDVLVNQDSLLNLIYVHDYPKLEVWKYLRTQPNPDRPLTPRDSIAWKQELEANPSGWKRISNYHVTLTGPFKSFYHKGVCHIITHDMKVYRLGAKALEPVDIRVKDPSKNCLLIDKRNQQVYLTRPPAAFGEGELKKSMEGMMRDRELLFKDK